MKRILVVAIIAMSLGLSCLAAEPAFLKIAGIDGEVTQKGREGQMEVLAWNHEVSASYDAASGQATGKRAHAPLRVVLRHSKAIPLLAEALAQNKAITAVDLMLWQTLPTGIEQNYFKYSLQNCRIVSMRAWSPNKLDSATSSYVPAVEVAIVYQSITWNSVPNAAIFTDTWQAGAQ